MNNDERIHLKRLLDDNKCEDNTEVIRKLKHSRLIHADIAKLQALKSKGVDEEQLKTECAFLYNGYTDIFNKVLCDELDLTIMTQLLSVLGAIEDGQVDQHEGSVAVGKILKELYVDSAMRRCDHLDSTNAQQEKVFAEAKHISWKQYKNEH
jgi:hypothetical protein